MNAEHFPNKAQTDEKADLIARGEFFWTDKEGNIRRDTPPTETPPVEPTPEAIPEPTPEKLDWTSLNEPDELPSYEFPKILSQDEREERKQQLRDVVEAFKSFKAPAAPDTDLMEILGPIRKTPRAESASATVPGKEGRKADNEEGRKAKFREERARTFAEKHGVRNEREALLSIRKELFEEKKRFYREHSGLERWHARGTGIGMEKLRELEMKHDELAASYAKALSAAVEKEPNEVTKMRAHLIHIEDSAIAAGQLENRARKEALDEKGRNLFERALGSYAGSMKALEGNLEQRFAKTGMSQKAAGIAATNAVRALRLLTTTSLVTGGLFAAGAVAPVGFATLFGSRLLRAGTGIFGGAATGTAAGVAYEKTYGAAARKERRLSRRMTVTSAADARTQRLAEQKGGKERIAENRKTVETTAASITALLTGLGWSHHAAAEAAGKIAPLESAQKAAGMLTNTPFIEMPPGAGAAAPASEAIAPPAETPIAGQFANPSVSVSISGKGEGAIKLFAHLQDSLREQGLTADNTLPDSDAHYILTHTPDQASVKFNFLTNEGSRIMHGGDTFTVDDQGHFVSQVSSEKFMAPPEAPPDLNAQKQAVTAHLNEEQLAPAPNEAPPLADQGYIEPSRPIVPLESESVSQTPPPEEATPTASEASYGLSPESFTNDHALRIDPSLSALFADEKEAISVFGGDFDSRAALAHQYITEHPGSHVRIMVEGDNAKYVGDYAINPETGTQQIVPVDEPPSRSGFFGFLGDLFRSRPKLDAHAFVRRIQP